MFDGYLWAKTLHIVLIASWFAGLFYLPRIFVNLAQETNDVAYERLIGMAQRLYRFMTILMMPAVALGLILWLYYGVGRGSIWMHVKVLLVLIVIGLCYVLSLFPVCFVFVLCVGLAECY